MAAANIDLQVRGKTEQAEKSLKNLGGSVKGLGSTVKSSFAGLAGMGGMLAGVLAPLAGGAFAGWGVKLAADNETATQAFATMLQSGGKAQLLMEKIKKFAAETPFETSDIVDASRTLLAFGVDASDVMTRIKTLGDVASGSGANIGEISSIFGKVFVKGKADLQDINQLAEKGIPIYTVLAKQLGVSNNAFLKMVSDGKINADMMQEALESMANKGGLFEDAMKKQSTTLNGLWSSFQDSISAIGLEIGQTVVEMFNLKGGVQSLTSFSETVVGTIKEWKPVVFAAFEMWVSYLKLLKNAFMGFVGIIQSALQPVIQWFTSQFGSSMMSFRDSMIVAFATGEYAITNWKAIMTYGVDAVKLVFLSFKETIYHLFAVSIPAIWNNFGAATAHFFEALGENIVNAFTEIWDYIKSGGQNPFEMEWKPVIMQEIKDAFKRELSEEEQALMSKMENERKGFTQGLEEFVGKKLEAANKVAGENKETLEGSGKQDQPQDEKEQKGKKGDNTNSAVERGTAEAIAAIYNIQAARETPEVKELKKQTKVQEKTNSTLAAIERKLQPGGFAVANI